MQYCVDKGIDLPQEESDAELLTMLARVLLFMQTAESLTQQCGDDDEFFESNIRDSRISILDDYPWLNLGPNREKNLVRLLSEARKAERTRQQRSQTRA